MKEFSTTDIYGNEVVVDMDTATIHTYSNRDREIVMNVQQIEDGKPTRFWTDITVEGTVDSIEERCRQFNNPLRLAYAQMMEFNASKNDPEKQTWNMLMAWANEHQDLLFDKYGDWKKIVIANPSKERIEVIENKRGGARKGAGRKPSGLPPKETWSVKVTEEEREMLKAYLETIREK